MRNACMFCVCGAMVLFYSIVIWAGLNLNEPVRGPVADLSLWVIAAIWFALELDEQRAQAQKEQSNE